jgi:hypothetical protein
MAAGSWGWRPYHLHVPNVTKIWESKPPGTLWATPSLLRDSFTLVRYINGLTDQFYKQTEISFKKREISYKYMNPKFKIYCSTNNMESRLQRMYSLTEYWRWMVTSCTPTFNVSELVRKFHLPYCYIFHTKRVITYKNRMKIVNSVTQ